MRRAFVMFGSAVIIALITSGLIYNWLQEKATAKAAALEIQPIVIAVIDIPWGTKITKGMVKKVDFPKGFLSVGHFSDPSSLEGRVTVFPVKANEPLFESRLAPMNAKGGGVAAVVSSRKRAVAIKMDKTIGGSGFVHPGSRVDVLITLRSGKKSVPVIKTILENIRVLAVGRETEEKYGKVEKPVTANVITLEVTPEEAEKLGLAMSEGKLLLALRNYGDTDDVLTKGTNITTLINSYSSDPVKERGPSVEKQKAKHGQVSEKAGQRDFGKEREYAYNPTGKPDPFKPFIQLTKKAKGFLPPLQNYDLSQLRLVAIIRIPKGNIGLVEDAAGKGYSLREGTLIGRNNGKVTKILRDRVVVEEIYEDVLHQKKVNEISLFLPRPEGR